MKFSEILQFTKTPAYHVDVDLDYLTTWLNKKIDEMNLQLNPDFQRGHVWTESQQIAYVEYLLRGGTSGREIYFNHPGWMTTWKGDFVCVDGLQRLTACLKFMDNKLPIFGHTLLEFEDSISMLHNRLSIHINNLQTKKEVLTWYLEMNTGGTIHTQEEIFKVRKMLQEEK